MSRITKRDQLLLALRDAINEAKITDGTEIAMADVVQPEGSLGDGERMKLMVCGVDMTWQIEGPLEIKKAFTGQPTGRYRFNVGMHGCKKQFLERGDDTFNLNRAAYQLVTLARAELLRNKQDKVSRDNNMLADQLQFELVPAYLSSRITIRGGTKRGMLSLQLRFDVDADKDETCRRVAPVDRPAVQRQDLGLTI